MLFLTGFFNGIVLSENARITVKHSNFNALKFANAHGGSLNPQCGSLGYSQSQLPLVTLLHEKACLIPLFLMSICSHYENIPMQYTEIFKVQQGSSNEYPQSMFWSKNNKNRYTPAYPSFTI